MMKKVILSVVAILFSAATFSQNVSELYTSDEADVTWLGIDFSGVKLVGKFSQFGEAGDKDMKEVRDKYFPSWNHLILSEPDKYNLNDMLRQGKVKKDIKMLMKHNAGASVDNMRGYDCPDKFEDKDLNNLVAEYNLDEVDERSGFGVLFIAECMNKYEEQAYFHFVVISLESGDILKHARFKGDPGGIGLRNYWAGAIHEVMDEVEGSHRKWKKEYK